MSGLEALMERRRLRAKICTSFGQSPIGALLLTNANDTYTNITSAFLIGFCATNENGSGGWLTSRGLIALADHIFQHSDKFRTLNEDLRRALFYGSLTAMWMIPSDLSFTTENIEEARTKILRLAESRCPPTAIIRQAVNGYLSLMNSTSSDSRHQMMLQWFPAKLTAGGAEHTNLFQNCNHGDAQTEFPAPSDDQIVLFRTLLAENERREIWQQLAAREITAFFNVLGYVSDTVEAEYAAAMFTMTATVAKSTFTDQWINNRWTSLKDEIQVLDQMESITEPVLTQYHRIFQQSNNDVKSKVGCLIINNWIAKSVKLDSLTRIAAQARAPHVSGCICSIKF